MFKLLFLRNVFFSLYIFSEYIDNAKSSKVVALESIRYNKLSTFEICFKVVFKKSEYRCVKYYILQGERQAFIYFYIFKKFIQTSKNTLKS